MLIKEATEESNWPPGCVLDEWSGLECFTFWVLSSVQSLSCIWLVATPGTAACQASLPITNSWSVFKLTSIELVMPSNHLIFCRPLLLPSSIFPTSGGQSIGASNSASVLPMNIQYCLPLGLTGLISLQSKGLSRVFSNTVVQKHHFFGAKLSLWFNSHIRTWLLEKPVGQIMDRARHRVSGPKRVLHTLKNAKRNV